VNGTFQDALAQFRTAPDVVYQFDTELELYGFLAT